jgi:cobalt-zinc-cadmium efflux system protein
MAHAHPHGHHHHHHDRQRGQRGLLIALGLTLTVFAAEVAGGLAGGSLALLADAGHLLADAAALGLALMAGWMASRPARGRHTFGWQRAEILAALANGVVLVLIAAATLFEAARRLAHPPHVQGGITLAVAAIGLIFNLTSAAVLLRAGSGLNVRAAMRHVLADAASSVGVIVAAGAILAFGWRSADPLASIAIAALILLSAASIVRESLDVLTVTSGFPTVAAHITVSTATEPSLVRRRTAEMLRKHFGIEHSTLQVEREGGEQALLQIRRGV